MNENQNRTAVDDGQRRRTDERRRTAEPEAENQQPTLGLVVHPTEWLMQDKERRNSPTAAQAALESAATEYRRLFENSIVGICKATPDGRLVRANPACAEMYGYDTPEQMLSEVSDVGRQLCANPEEHKEVLRILSEKGALEPREFSVVRRDGTRFFVIVSVREIRDAAGAPVSYQATHLDITARKQAEAECEKLRAQLAQAKRMEAVGRLMTKPFTRAELAGRIREILGPAQGEHGRGGNQSRDPCSVNG